MDNRKTIKKEEKTEICPKCFGTGEIVISEKKAVQCDICKGNKKITKEELQYYNNNIELLL